MADNNALLPCMELVQERVMELADAGWRSDVLATACLVESAIMFCVQQATEEQFMGWARDAFRKAKEGIDAVTSAAGGSLQ